MMAARASGISPHMIRHIRQSAPHGDCAVACLATIAGLTYEEVLLQAARVKPGVLKQGLCLPDFHKTARRVGMKLCVQKVTTEALEDGTGILWLKRLNPNSEARSLTEEHAVVLWAGRVIEGDGEMWLDAQDYLKHYAWEPTRLLVRTDG